MTDKPGTIIEVSWEVANKVGGIYTVVKTKARYCVQKYPDYLMVGPLFKQTKEFKQKAPPKHIQEAFRALEEKNIHCIYGIWDIPGQPKAVLINAQDGAINLDQVKTRLWDEYRIDSLYARWDFNEPLQWAWAAGMLCEKIAQTRRVVVHAHEWMAGFAILYSKMNRINAGSVFTTHATILGRTLSARNEKIRPWEALQKAKEYNIIEKHTTEVACATNSDVFTTVSDITAKEAEYLLGIKPRMVLYNGIDENIIIPSEQMLIEHEISREKINDFITYFFAGQKIDLNKTKVLFTSGRNEFINKGMDVSIKAIAKLDKTIESTIIMFFFVPLEVRGINTCVVERQQVFNKTKDIILKDSLRKTRNIILGTENNDNKVIIDAGIEDNKAPLSTHNLTDDYNNDFIRAFKECNLLNNSSNKVKVVLYPVYLDGDDGLLNMKYDDVIRGCDLGIFASLYEPWGYTPVESLALGVPAITSDTAGFGRYVNQRKGVYVIRREGNSTESASRQIYEIIMRFLSLSEDEEKDMRKEAQKIAMQCTWQKFINQYYQAHLYAYTANNISYRDGSSN